MISPEVLRRIPFRWLRLLVFRWSAWHWVKNLSDEDLELLIAVAQTDDDTSQA